MPFKKRKFVILDFCFFILVSLPYEVVHCRSFLGVEGIGIAVPVNLYVIFCSNYCFETIHFQKKSKAKNNVFQIDKSFFQTTHEMILLF